MASELPTRSLHDGLLLDSSASDRTKGLVRNQVARRCELHEERMAHRGPRARRGSHQTSQSVRYSVFYEVFSRQVHKENMH